MKYYSMYYTDSEAIIDKYDCLNYWTLEELWELTPETDFEVELFQVGLNSVGKERHAKCVGQSDAFNMLMHDMANKESTLRNTFSVYSRYLSLEAANRLTDEEKTSSWYVERETWIICCERLFKQIAVYNGAELDDSAYMCDGHKSDFYFRFNLPKEIPAQVFRGTDLDFFLACVGGPNDFKLSELGIPNVFKYAVVPLYWTLARFAKNSNDKGLRDLTRYYVGLA